MIILTLKDFMKKLNLKNDTMNESEIERVAIYPINPRDSKKYLKKVFLNIDNGSMGGSHWCCFIIKESKSFFFDSFGSQPDKT